MEVRKLLFAIAFCSIVVPVSEAQGLFSGDQKDACEALLCLSSGKRPDECEPPIRRYMSIRHRRIEDTLNARRDFLDMCPKGGDAQMNTLVNAIVHGAGACDAATLNTTLRRYSSDRYSNKSYIQNTMPDYCITYYTHPYTDLAATLPMYAGDHWVAPADYAAAMANYTARMAAAKAREYAASRGFR